MAVVVPAATEFVAQPSMGSAKMPVAVEVIRVFVDKIEPAIERGDEPNGMLGMGTIARSTLSAATMQLVDRDPPAAFLSQGAPYASPTSRGVVDDESNHTLAIEESVAPLDSQVCGEIPVTPMTFVTLSSPTRAEYTLVGSLAKSKNITGVDGVASDVANDSSPFGRDSHKVFEEASMANEASLAFTKTKPHGEAKLSGEL